MIKFIKLTEAMSNNNTTPIILNAASISSIRISSKGIDTHICIDNGPIIKYYFVKESVEQIWEMLNTDFTRAPVVMNADEALRYYKNKDGV